MFHSPGATLPLISACAEQTFEETRRPCGCSFDLRVRGADVPSKRENPLAGL